MPSADSHARRVAMTVQLLAVLVLVWTTLVLTSLGTPVFSQPFGVLTAVLWPLTLATLILVRSGRHVVGTWMFVMGLTGGLAVTFGIAGIEHSAVFVRLLAIPLTVAALVLGRRGLWVVLSLSAAALGIAYARDSGLLGPLPAFAAADLAIGVVPGTLMTLAFVAIALDGLGASLHRALYDLSRQMSTSAELSRRVAADEKRWRSLLDGVELLVYGVRPDGTLDYVNPWFSRVTGYAAGELLGRRYEELIPARDRSAVAARAGAALAGGEVLRAEAPLVTRDGSERVIAWSTVAQRDDGDAVVGLLGIGADVTGQRQAEASRDEALRDLRVLKTRLEEENLYLREELSADLGAGGIVGESDALKYVLLRIHQVASSDATVLIEGETGVGKELVARAIHEKSGRAAGAFVRVNCAALPAQIVESELFGHEAGAFTGASRLRKGRFELADRGTIFLDEIGEMPLELQAKLLRVLQEGELERVGGTRVVKVNVRVIVATNRNLRAEVAAGRFREDLFYRLNVFPITVPPLRDRRDDIPLLIRHFVPQLAARSGRHVREIPGPLMRTLVEHDWPGNVRELRNVLERAVLQCADGTLRLPEPLGGATAPVRDGAQSASTLAHATLEVVERQHILATLRRTRGQVSGPAGAAALLGLHANTLRSRMKKLGIRVERTLEGVSVGASGESGATHGHA